MPSSLGNASDSRNSPALVETSENYDILFGISMGHPAVFSSGAIRCRYSLDILGSDLLDFHASGHMQPLTIPAFNKITYPITDLYTNQYRQGPDPVQVDGTPLPADHDGDMKTIHHANFQSERPRPSKRRVEAGTIRQVLFAMTGLAPSRRNPAVSAFGATGTRTIFEAGA